jgi:uncharacterized protein (DUF849 family)
MPAHLARQPESSLSGFISEVKALNRTATAVEKLSPSALRRDIKASRVVTVVRDIDTLQRRIERIRQSVEEYGVPGARAVRPHGADSLLQRLVRGKELLDPAAFAEAMGWSRQALSKALSTRRVFFVEFNSTRYFPAFFARKDLERRQVEAVSKLMGDLPGGAKLAFFLNRKGSLDRKTPVEALAAGQLTEVRAAAEGYAQA